MNIITQNTYQRQRMLKYLKNHTATETAIRYKISRKNYTSGKIGMTEHLRVSKTEASDLKIVPKSKQNKR